MGESGLSKVDVTEVLTTWCRLKSEKRTGRKVLDSSPERNRVELAGHWYSDSLYHSKKESLVIRKGGSSSIRKAIQSSLGAEALVPLILCEKLIRRSLLGTYPWIFVVRCKC